MAPSNKRKPAEDDFIYTIDDDDELPVEEEEVTAEPPKKKAKTAKKSKKSKRAASPENEDEESDGAEGIWGFKDEDDGAMDSDFEFGGEDNNDLGTEEFEGWGFDGAKKGMNADKKGVDLDEIIRRRREKKLGKSTEDAPEAEENEVEAEAMKSTWTTTMMRSLLTTHSV